MKRPFGAWTYSRTEDIRSTLPARDPPDEIHQCCVGLAGASRTDVDHVEWVIVLSHCVTHKHSEPPSAINAVREPSRTRTTASRVRCRGSPGKRASGLPCGSWM